jgi:hypothetical protein
LEDGTIGVGQRGLLLMAATLDAFRASLDPHPVPGAVPDFELPKWLKAPGRANGLDEKLERCTRLLRIREYMDRGWPSEVAVFVPEKPNMFSDRVYRQSRKTLMTTLERSLALGHDERIEYLKSNVGFSMDDLWLAVVLPISNAKDATSLLTYIGAQGMART